MGEDSRSLPLSSCSLDQYNSIQCTTCNQLNTSAVYSLVISAHCCIWLTLPVNVRNLTEALVHSVCVGCGQTSNMALLFVMASTSVLCSLSFCSISSLNDDISLHTHTHTLTLMTETATVYIRFEFGSCCLKSSGRFLRLMSQLWDLHNQHYSYIQYQYLPHAAVYCRDALI